jgi:hypothetical protein
MKKVNLILLVLFIFSFSKDVLAEWKKITTNLNGDSFYIDLNKIEKNNELVKFWVLIDSSKKASSKRSGIKSVKTQQQCECESSKYKTITWSFYSLQMGKGKSTDKSDFYADHFMSSNYWTYPSPKSSEEKVIKIVCEKVKNNQ